MKLVKDYDIKTLVKLIEDNSVNNKYYNAQIEIRDKHKNEQFLRYCKELATFTYIDELGGTPLGENKHSYIRRYRIDKTFDDVIHKADTGIACGIKVTPKPAWELHEYERWSGGYIECFVRMDAEEFQVDWFIWMYIKMEHLGSILEKFKNDLEILKK